MAKRNMPSYLTASEYLIRNQDGQDNQIACARWQFIEAVGRVVPAFLERLQDQVYPEYACLADIDPEFWVMGSSFETWQLDSDRDNQFTPVLMAWAQGFNVQGEAWILQGALQTLSYWHQFPLRRAALDISGFRQWNVTEIISSEDHQFRFSDWGWDPTFLSFAGWRTNIRKLFGAALEEHESRMRKLVVDRGAIPAVVRFSKEHFEWLALYQCGNLSLDSILRRAHSVGDKSTVSKGMHNAATLAAIAVRPRRRNPSVPI